MYTYKVYSYDECPKDLFRFRYEVYVEELHRKQSYACHDTRTIEDPLDATGHHGIVHKDGEIIACVRLNIVREGGVQPYFDFYEMGRLPKAEQITASICTRNMVAKPYRNTGVSVRMLKLIYLHGIENGVTTCFMDVNEPLIGLFQKFGYKALFEKEHPDYGLVTVMRLDALDCAYLREIRSPFARLCTDFIDKQHAPSPA